MTEPKSIDGLMKMVERVSIFRSDMPVSDQLAAIRAYAESLAQPDVDALHAAIVAMPCNLALCPTEATTVMAYTRGHRDARHAAAELVNGLRVKP